MRSVVRWSWIVPVIGVAASMGFALGTGLGFVILGLLVGGVAIIPASKHPVGVLVTVLVALPMQYVIFPLILRLGVPAGIVRQLNLTKEWGLLVLLVVILRQTRSLTKKNRADSLIAGFLGIAALYLLLPVLHLGLFEQLPFNARSTAFRTDCLGLLFFLVVRRLDLGQKAYLRLSNTVILLGVILSSGAILEAIAPVTWKTFLVSVLHTPEYRAQVYGFSGVARPNGGRNAASILSYADFGGLHVLRPGSLLLSPLALATYLLIPFGLSLVKTLGRHGLAAWLPTALIGIGLVISLTRSAVLAAGLMVLMVMLRTRTKVVPRVVTLIAVVLLVMYVPSVQTLSARSLGSQADTNSTQGHQEAFFNGLNLLREKPLGLGLGVQPGRSATFVQSGATVATETGYLQTGVELGVIPMVLFILGLGSVLISLRRRSFQGCDEVRVALTGLAIMALFLPIWLDLNASVTIWVLAGLALKSADSDIPSLGRGADSHGLRGRPPTANISA